ncbi:UNVERIFIED_CONTAM: hypothetical protein H355_008996 [Colinus virginianus]|nr:hypothetical protein H355_008996 [Colinus virginianus]
MLSPRLLSFPMHSVNNMLRGATKPDLSSPLLSPGSTWELSQAAERPALGGSHFTQICEGYRIGKKLGHGFKSLAWFSPRGEAFHVTALRRRSPAPHPDGKPDPILFFIAWYICGSSRRWRPSGDTHHAQPRRNELITRLTGLHCSTDSTNSSDNIYTMINPVPPAGSRSNFPMGPGSDGPMGGMGGMEPHHMNGSLGSGDIDGLPKNSPNNISGISNPPGTPRDDGELGGNFLHSFQNDNVSPGMRTGAFRPGFCYSQAAPGQKVEEEERIKRVSCRSEDLKRIMQEEARCNAVNDRMKIG